MGSHQLQACGSHKKGLQFFSSFGLWDLIPSHVLEEL
jgi:hypothetical protein